MAVVLLSAHCSEYHWKEIHENTGNGIVTQASQLALQQFCT